MVSASDPLALLPPGDGTLGHVAIGDITLVTGVVLPAVTLAVQRWGRINEDRSNVVLVEHALTGDSHVVGPVDSLHPTPGWWNGLVGPGLPLDTDRYCVVSVNVLGGCRGSTGPSSLHFDGHYWGARFPPSRARHGTPSGCRRPARHRALGCGDRRVHGRCPARVDDHPS